MKLGNLLQQIYVVHYEPLNERKEKINNSLKSIEDVPVKYMIMNAQTDENIKKTFHNVYKGSSKISFQEVAVSIAHLNIYKDILKNNFNKCLIVEDDAILGDLFFDNIVNAIIESDNFDFSFLSSCCNLHVNKQSISLLQVSETSRSVCGYLVKLSCMEKVINNCEPFEHVIDWHLNHIRNKLDLKFSWSEPPIIGQGSEREYKSNLHSIRMNRM